MIVTRHNQPPKEIAAISPFIQKWRPVDGWLVKERNGEFVLPTYHSILGSAFYRAYKKTVKRNIALVLTTVVLVCFTTSAFAPKVIEIFPAMALMLIVVTLDMLLSISSLQNCQRKIELIYTLCTSFKYVGLRFGLFFAAIIAAQIYFENRLGGFEQLVINYGNYYPHIDVSSLWRFATGAFIHQNIHHWLVNATLTILFAALVPASKSFVNFTLFFIAAIGSHIAAYIAAHFYPSTHDALVGASGGAYALLAFAISYYLKKKYFNITVSLVGLLVFAELSIYLTATNGSHSAHWSGFSIGLLAYWLRLAPLKSQPPDMSLRQTNTDK